MTEVVFHGKHGDLSTRARNILRYAIWDADTITPQHVAEYAHKVGSSVEIALLRIPGCGRSTLVELMNWCGEEMSHHTKQHAKWATTRARIRGWGKIYAKYFPTFTCPMSRHVKVISEGMRKGDMRKAILGWDPDHMAESLEGIVVDLWEARKLLDEAGYDRVEVNGKWVWRKRDADPT